jgi:putative molybdopterin biosynthesis protein
MKQTEPAVMTVSEVAEYLRVARPTVYNLLRKNKLPGFRVGYDYRVHRETLERWLVEHEFRPETPKP